MPNLSMTSLAAESLPGMQRAMQHASISNARCERIPRLETQLAIDQANGAGHVGHVVAGIGHMQGEQLGQAIGVELGQGGFS